MSSFEAAAAACFWRLVSGVACLLTPEHQRQPSAQMDITAATGALLQLRSSLYNPTSKLNHAKWS